jgi:dolichol-phosphate mannosyltransferase
MLVQEIHTHILSITNNYEIILVDDGSKDNSWKEIENISSTDAKVKGIKLSRNFGQHYAIIAGLEQATGEWIAVMDCDLQDNPEEIPALYNKAQEGFAIVTASRTDRKDPFLKKCSSRLFWKTLSYLTGMSLNYKVANFGIYHKDVIKAITSLKESIPFFPTMVLWTGYKRTTIGVEHGFRHSGETGYSYYRMIKLAIDIILANSDKPIRIVIRVGFGISMISFLIGLYYFVLHLANKIIIPGFTSLIISIWFLGGLTILILGILGLYLGKTFEGVKGRPNYIIEKTTNQAACLLNQ